MNKTGMIASFSLVCMPIGSAWAVDLRLFEQDFLRGKGEPDSYGGSFVVQAHQAKLVISNVGANESAA